MFMAAGLFHKDTPLWIILPVSFIGGIGTGFISTGLNYMMQKETPPEAIGRVSGIYDSMSSVVFIVSPLTGGVLIGLWGASFTFLSVGIGVGSVGLIGVVLQRWLWRTAKSSEKKPSLMV
jgi:predicted MFS family arabinose efflux permease